MENIDWNVIIPAIIGIVGGGGGVLAVAKKVLDRGIDEVKNLLGDIEKLKTSVKFLTQYQLLKELEKHINNGFFPSSDRSYLQAKYEAYKDLGGNGNVTSLYNLALNLPLERKI
jgi:hypothetical protein